MSPFSNEVQSIFRDNFVEFCLDCLNFSTNFIAALFPPDLNDSELLFLVELDITTVVLFYINIYAGIFFPVRSLFVSLSIQKFECITYLKLL